MNFLSYFLLILFLFHVEVHSALTLTYPGVGVEGRDIACTLPKGLFSLTPFMNHELFFMFYHGFPSSGDGKWSAWKPWSPCSVSCSLGTQSRSRTCTNPPPTFGGKDCVGKSDETKSCNKGPCPGKSPF